jgi:hypothetical protein
MRVMTSVRAYREAHGLVGEEQRQHDEIADAIRRRDPDAAAAAMEQHLTSSMELVRSVEDGSAGKKSVPRQRRSKASPSVETGGPNPPSDAEPSTRSSTRKKSASQVSPQATPRARAAGGRTAK